MRRLPRACFCSLMSSGAALLLSCHSELDPVRLGRAQCTDLTLGDIEYALCEVGLDHASAAGDCARRGAHLAAPRSAEENLALADALFAVVTSGNVWLGGSRSADFSWTWPDGSMFWRGGRDGEPEPEAFVLWQAGEPNNTSSQTGEDEACLALTAEGADWNDRSCRLALPYVCQQD